MLRIGICDDIADARLLLQDALERVLEMGGWEAQFFQFSSGEGLLDWYAKHLGELDLVFLDMKMKTLSGIDTAKRLRALDDSLQLAFCTSYSDYVFDGYGTGALGYLLKPPRQEQLEEVLRRAQAALLRGSTKPTSPKTATPPTVCPIRRSSISHRNGAKCTASPQSAR